VRSLISLLDGTPVNQNLAGTVLIQSNVAFPPGDPFFGVGAFEVTQTLAEATPNFILVPVFSNLALETKVSVFDGATVVLGGLIQSNRTKVEDKAPILGSLPLVGKLFKGDVEETVNKHILITVTAKVIDPTGRSLKPSF